VDLDTTNDGKKATAWRLSQEAISKGGVESTTRYRKKPARTGRGGRGVRSGRISRSHRRYDSGDVYHPMMSSEAITSNPTQGPSTPYHTPYYSTHFVSSQEDLEMGEGGIAQVMGRREYGLSPSDSTMPTLSLSSSPSMGSPAMMHSPRMDSPLMGMSSRRFPTLSTEHRRSPETPPAMPYGSQEEPILFEPEAEWNGGDPDYGMFLNMNGGSEL
jgi:hypothetical protein